MNAIPFVVLSSISCLAFAQGIDIISGSASADLTMVINLPGTSLDRDEKGGFLIEFDPVGPTSTSDGLSVLSSSRAAGSAAWFDSDIGTDFLVFEAQTSTFGVLNNDDDGTIEATADVIGNIEFQVGGFDNPAVIVASGIMRSTGDSPGCRGIRVADSSFSITDASVGTTYSAEIGNLIATEFPIRPDSSFTITFDVSTLTRINNRDTTCGTDPSIEVLISMEEGCTAADLATPRGVLDLADVARFADAFVNGDSLVDIADPFRVLDLRDIVFFIDSFLGGCQPQP